MHCAVKCHNLHFLSRILLVYNGQWIWVHYILWPNTVFYFFGNFTLASVFFFMCREWHKKNFGIFQLLVFQLFSVSMFNRDIVVNVEAVVCSEFGVGFQSLYSLLHISMNSWDEGQLKSCHQFCQLFLAFFVNYNGFIYLITVAYTERVCAHIYTIWW